MKPQRSARRPPCGARAPQARRTRPGPAGRRPSLNEPARARRSPPRKIALENLGVGTGEANTDKQEPGAPTCKLSDGPPPPPSPPLRNGFKSLRAAAVATAQQAGGGDFPTSIPPPPSPTPPAAGGGGGCQGDAPGTPALVSPPSGGGSRWAALPWRRPGPPRSLQIHFPAWRPLGHPREVPRIIGPRSGHCYSPASRSESSV